MPLNEDQHNKLDMYVHRFDRDTEPVFVGRHREIKNLEGNLRGTHQGHHKGRTICLSGPPGIGKTALLEECRRQVAENNSAIWATVRSNLLHNPDALVCAAAEAVSQIPKERINDTALTKCKKFLQRWMPEIKATAGLNVFVAQFNVILQPDPKKKQQTQVAFDVPWTALSYFRESVKGNPPFVIAVDEAHGLIGSDGLHGTANYILQNLHEGGAVPIIPILAGHVHTPEVIEESISERLAEEQSLFMTNLSKSESRDYVRGVLDHLEADGDFNAIADWIYGESDGFPHHIRGALSSIAKCMLKTNSLRIADLDINAIEQTFSAGRCNYYARRMGEDLPDYDAAVSAALKVAETPKSVSRKTIIQTLKQGIQDMIESGDAPPDPLEARAILKILIRRGAIARTGPTHYTCLIRSLARFADFQTHAPHAPFPAEKPRPRNNGSRPMGVP